jgi:hypothetical protein
VTTNPGASLSGADKAVLLGVLLKAGPKAANLVYQQMMKNKLIGARRSTKALSAPRKIEAR